MTNYLAPLIFIKSKHPLNLNLQAGLSPLHIAAFMGHVDLLELLTSKGAEINSSTIQQETPLHLAIRADQFDCAHYLVDHGADIGALTKARSALIGTFLQIC